MSFDIRDKSVVATYITAGNYGYYSIGLDEYDTDAEPELQAGFVEVGGEIYENTAALAITGWAGIAVSTQTYVYIVPGGTTATCIFSSTAPTWSNDKRGWYNSNDRALFTVYKDSTGTGYWHKQELKGRNVITGGTTVTAVTFATATTNGVDFTVYEAGLYYGIFDIVATPAGAAIAAVIQAKINGTYTDIADDYNIYGDNVNGVAGTFNNTSKLNSYYMMLLPGTYRLVLRKTANPVTNTPTCTLYRAGRLSNND